MNKNWPNDDRVGCKSPSNLVELIKTTFDIKEKLKKFEGAFEWDVLLNI